MTGHPVLDIESVSKSFGTVDILRQVSLRVEPGSVVAIVGHNGAGKTTLMRMVLGLVHPDSGEVRLGGIPVVRLGSLGGLVGASLDASALPASWRTRTALRMAADLAGVADRQAREALALVGLADVDRRRIGNLSAGMRQRLAIAIALVATPRLLMLDEPTNALDPAISYELRGWLGEHAARGNSVLLSSHNLSEVEEVADRIIVINRGQVVQDAAKSTMLAADSAVVRVDQPDILTDRLGQLGYVSEQLPDGAIRVHGLAAGEIGGICAQLGLTVRELRSEQRRLSDIYQSLTTQGATGDDRD
jgi:ABC-2 type transport system ATP-binding protein